MTRRRVLLVVTLIFIAALLALTVVDLIRYGVNALNVLSILILAMFWIGIVGALRAPPPR
jgi:hypothetical protein